MAAAASVTAAQWRLEPRPRRSPQPSVSSRRDRVAHRRPVALAASGKIFFGRTFDLVSERTRFCACAAAVNLPPSISLKVARLDSETKRRRRGQNKRYIPHNQSTIFQSEMTPMNVQAGEQNAMGDDPSAKIQHLNFGCLRQILMYILFC